MRRDDIPLAFNEYDILIDNADRFQAANEGVALPPYEVIIHPSSVCNLVCDWCIGDHIPAAQENSVGDIVIVDAAKTSIDRLAEKLREPSVMTGVVRDMLSYSRSWQGKEYRIERFSFSGLIGEPLVAKEALTESLPLIKNSGRAAGIFSNCILLDDNVNNVLHRIDYINFSMDAATPKTYSALKYSGNTHGETLFKRALNNIASLVKSRPADSSLEVNASFILYPENYVELFSAAAIAKDLGVRYFRIKQDIAGRRILSKRQLLKADELLRKAEDELQDSSFDIVAIHNPNSAHKSQRAFKTCRITDIVSAVGSDGSVFPCNYHPRPDGIVYGNLVESSFATIWESRRRLEQKCRLPKECPSVCDPFKMRSNELLNNSEFLVKHLA